MVGGMGGRTNAMTVTLMMVRLQIVEGELGILHTYLDL